MPRAVCVRSIAVPAPDRAAALARFRANRDVVRAMACRHWVFEDADAPGSFLEFIEADTPGRAAESARATDAAAGPTAAPARLYLEVELN